MSVNTIYNYNPTPEDISREEYTDVGSSAFQLGTAARTFGIDTDFEIWTSASGGTQLTEGADYELLTKNNLLSSKLGFDVKTRVRILNATYQTGSIFFTYKCYASETDAAYFNYLNSTDESLHATDESLQIQINTLAGASTLETSSDYQILDDDGYTIIEVDTATAGADVTITMPLLSNNINRQIEIAHITDGSYSVFVVPYSTDTNTLTTDGLSTIELPKNGDFIKFKNSGISDLWEMTNKKITCHLRLDTHAGYGSTDTAIARFTNLEEINGNLFTENHVSGYNGNAEGLEITILKSGIYSVCLNRYTGATYIGLTLNSAELTTSIVSITSLTSRLAIGGLTGGAVTVGCTRFFDAGDVIRPHYDKSGASSTLVKFEIEYIG